MERLGKSLGAMRTVKPGQYLRLKGDTAEARSLNIFQRIARLFFGRWKSTRSDTVKRELKTRIRDIRRAIDGIGNTQRKRGALIGLSNVLHEASETAYAAKYPEIKTMLWDAHLDAEDTKPPLRNL